MQATTNNRVFFEEILNTINGIKYFHDQNEVELVIKKERATLILSDINKNIIKGEIQEHFNDNHTTVDQDATHIGVWYIHYPDEESATQAAIKMYDTEIGEGDNKCYVK
jgi:hypothetical protein